MNYDAQYGMYGMESEIMEFLEEFGPMLIGIVAVAVLFALAWAVLTYVLTSLSLYTVATRRGIQNPWLAWIPVADRWIMGCISDQYQYVVKGKVTNRRKILLGLSVAGFAVSFVMNLVSKVLLMAAGGEAVGVYAVVSGLTSVLNAGLTVTSLVFTQIALYDYYASVSPDNKVLFLVLGILFAFLQPFFLFFNRRSDAGMPPRRPEPAYAPVDAVYEQPAPQADPWDRPDNA